MPWAELSNKRHQPQLRAQRCVSAICSFGVLSLRIVIAVHGTRGDVEPCLAIARELRARGHSVALALPPNMLPYAIEIDFHETFTYGPNSAEQLHSNLFINLHNLWLKPWRLAKEARKYMTDRWQEMGSTLYSLSLDADLIVTGTTYQDVALNVAEARHLPLAALHMFPCRANNFALPILLPKPFARVLFHLIESVYAFLLRPADAIQRRTLDLPPDRKTQSERMRSNHSLEIQIYDRIFFPGIESQLGRNRPLVGSLTLARPSFHDKAVLEWISSGDPPIYIGLGSMDRINDRAILQCIVRHCLSLSMRVLFCGSGTQALSTKADSHNHLFVDSLCHQLIFPRCRLVTHHGGSGTTGAVLRAGVPSILLWVSADQPVWAKAVRKLGIGASHRLSSLTQDRWATLLSTALSSQVAERARCLQRHAIKSDRALSRTADLLEQHAHQRLLSHSSPESLLF